MVILGLGVQFSYGVSVRMPPLKSRSFKTCSLETTYGSGQQSKKGSLGLEVLGKPSERYIVTREDSKT